MGLNYYDPRIDALGALTLGGIGALSGLGYSLLDKKQRKNKLRNALIGAAMLPSAYIGSKWLLSKCIPQQEIMRIVYDKDPLTTHIAYPVFNKLFYSSSRDAAKKYNNLRNGKTANGIPRLTPVTEKELADVKKELADAKSEAELEYDWNYHNAANSVAALGYGTLGAGIGLPALYLKYLKKKNKKLEDEELS